MNSDFLTLNNDGVIRGETCKESLVASACLLFFILHIGVIFSATENSGFKNFILTSNEEGMRIVPDNSPLSSLEGGSDPATIPSLAPFLFLPIAINSCDKTLLMTIRGIGPELAGRILRTRTQMGDYLKPEDLLQVNGIGSARLRAISPFLSFVPSIQ